MLGSTSNGFGATECREVSLKGNAYDFSADHNPTDKSDILNTHYLMVKNNIFKYLMVKNNVKECIGLLKKIHFFVIC